MKILLVSSTGGHFTAMCQLSDYWKQHERCWVTFSNSTSEKTLENEQKYWAYGPTNRNLKNLGLNLILAIKILVTERPDLILSTGAGVAVPFILLGKILGIKTAFIESFTRVKELSLSARLVLPFIDKLYVQWESLQAKYPQAELIQL